VIEQDTSSFLRVDQLFKSFQDKLVLKDIHLKISEGHIYGLLGPNGAGKTTLLKILAGLLKPDSGTVTGNPSRIGFCPQSPLFWRNLKVREQLRFFGQLYQINVDQMETRIQFLLEKLGLKKFEFTLTERLSGGIQKRLNLALSLIHSPNFLLLDEPTANLDLESKEFVRQLLLHLQKKENVTILCSSHDLDEISNLATDIVFLSEGKIVYNEKIKKEDVSLHNFQYLKELYQKIKQGAVLI